MLRMKDKKTDETFLLQTPAGDLVCSVIRTGRKTYGCVVREGGQVEMRIPLRGSVHRAKEMAGQWKDWIIDKVREQNLQQAKKERLQQESRKRFSNAQREQLEKQYRAAAKAYIPGRAKYYADILGVHFERVRIGAQKTRWGSCSARGTLSFHWKLMLAPPKVLDYVIVHEVCHLKEMNHSGAFWSWVGFLMPDYGEQRKWLKEHGEELQYY